MKSTKKPWGFEFEIFSNDQISFWVLAIKSGHSTSMHVHKQKKASVISLAGKPVVNFINDSQSLEQGKMIVIRPGLFHQIEASTCAEYSIVAEIENNIDRNDIIRLKDEYGRTHKKYEWDLSISKEECMQQIQLTIEDSKVYLDKQCMARKIVMNNVEEVNAECNYAIIDGGLTDSCGTYIAQVGDVITGATIKKLAKRFSFKPINAFEF